MQVTEGNKLFENILLFCPLYHRVWLVVRLPWTKLPGVLVKIKKKINIRLYGRCEGMSLIIVKPAAELIELYVKVFIQVVPSCASRNSFMYKQIPIFSRITFICHHFLARSSMTMVSFWPFATVFDDWAQNYFHQVIINNNRLFNTS